jgi:hypothetical protein
MMFGSVSKHFSILRHINRSKTFLSGLNAVFRGTDVAKHPFYSIVLTQNLHLAPNTQQAEQAGFTREEITRRASQFSLKINKRQSS